MTTELLRRAARPAGTGAALLVLAAALLVNATWAAAAYERLIRVAACG